MGWCGVGAAPTGAAPARCTRLTAHRSPLAPHLHPPLPPGCSDFTLHAFCYNAGPDFAAYRLDKRCMMASAKFRFLARLLKEVRAKWGACGRAWGFVWYGWHVVGWGEARGNVPARLRPPRSRRPPGAHTHARAPPPLCARAAGGGWVAAPHLQPVDRGARHHGVDDGGAAAALRAPRRLHGCAWARGSTGQGLAAVCKCRREGWVGVQHRRVGEPAGRPRHPRRCLTTTSPPPHHPSPANAARPPHPAWCSCG